MSEQQDQTSPPEPQPHAQTDRQTDAAQPGAEHAGDQQVVIVGPDGQPVGTIPASALQGGGDDGDHASSITELVEQPAKVMRIGSMIKQLLEEVKSAPLDEASRVRLKEIHTASITELEQGLAPELVEELERLSLPFTDGVPSEGELRIAQAQLVGWLEGLFHGIQTAIYAQQMSARAQFEQIRRALPQGMPDGAGRPGGPGAPGGPGVPGQQGGGSDEPSSGGMYL